jgi:hypothetical protein
MGFERKYKKQVNGKCLEGFLVPQNKEIVHGESKQTMN